MLTIRLARVGKKKQPNYRLIINEKSKDTYGDFLENLGFYNPRTKETNLKVERIKYWLSKGAQTSNTVHNLLVSKDVIKAKKVKAWRPKNKKDDKKKEGGEKKPASAETNASDEARADKPTDKEEKESELKDTPAEKIKSEEVSR